MRWYGIEVSKFCGALVGSGEPQVAPKFNLLIGKIKKVFSVTCRENEADTLNIGFSLGKRTFKVSMLTDDLEVFNVAFVKNNKSFNILQD